MQEQIISKLEELDLDLEKLSYLLENEQESEKGIDSRLLALLSDIHSSMAFKVNEMLTPHPKG